MVLPSTIHLAVYNNDRSTIPAAAGTWSDSINPGGKPRATTRPPEPGNRSKGRALLATAALDPTFGTGGQVFGLFGSDSASNSNSASAVAVAGDGKIVVAGTVKTSGAIPTLAVRRFNPDGTVDTTFGTNGETDLPLPATTTSLLAPRNLLIKADGSVILAAGATLPLPFPDLVAPSTSFVAQLTPNGQLDASFGTNGEFTLPGRYDAVNAVALQTDGSIIAAGIRTVFSADNGLGTTRLLATRLTAAGTPDTGFNGTGELVIVVPGATQISVNGAAVLRDPLVAVAPSGQIYLGTNLSSGGRGATSIPGGLLARINGDGTLDTSYGSAGILSLNPDLANTLGGIAVQADNKLVVAGTINQVFGSLGGHDRPSAPFLQRFTAAGSVDPSFAGAPLTLASTQVGPPGGFTSVLVGADGSITVGGYTTLVTGSPSNLRFTPNRFLAAHYNTSGRLDTSFGVYGRMTFFPTTPAGTSYQLDPAIVAVALTSTNQTIVLGSLYGTNSAGNIVQPGFLARLSSVRIVNNNTNDFDGDGKTDVAAELTTQAIYAYRKSNGTGDILQGFGQTGVGLSIPTPGDYDGDGKPDVSVYLPTLGALAYRPSSGGDDVIDFFGSNGFGASIPAPGDYDGDGKTDVAVYLPASKAFAIQYTGGRGSQYAFFGVSGTNESIPAARRL